MRRTNASSAIRFDQVSKKYRIGAKQVYDPYRTLRESLTEATAKAVRPITRHFTRASNTSADPGLESQNTFWALKGVHFDVLSGQVVGIIGRNGAGKSTLLKILSRITDPTEGCIEIRGRVASLLEVGTGFHPELTGRENIYLNGSILGMSRREINRKFSRIVDFAEIDKFLDTPVKRFSSGMYVRLAFAVAAHLEPEILVVDEVLAVGDQAFQNKCIGKMQETAGEGRTVLFVTHNMQAVHDLCTRAILLERGSVAMDGDAADVVLNYLERQQTPHDELCDLNHAERSSLELRWRAASLTSCCLSTRNKPGAWNLLYGQPLTITVEVTVQEPADNLELMISVGSLTGHEIATSLSRDALQPRPAKPGIYQFQMTIHELALVPGRYTLGLGLRSDRGMEDHVPIAARFEVHPSPDCANMMINTRSGSIIPRLSGTMKLQSQIITPEPMH